MTLAQKHLDAIQAAYLTGTAADLEQAAEATGGKVDQDWEAEATLIRYDDGSSIRRSGPSVTVEGVQP